MEMQMINDLFKERYVEDGGKILKAEKLIQDIVIAIVAFSIFMGSFYVNSEYERSLITQLGKFEKTTGPGIHLKIPFIQSQYVADTRMDKMSIKDISIATKGGSNIVFFDLTLNHRINDTDNSAILKLFKLFGSTFDYEKKLFSNLITDRLKAIVSRYSIEEIVEKRSKIRSELFLILVEEGKKYSIIVKDVQLQNLKYGDDYKKRLQQVSEARAKAAAEEQGARAADFEAQKKVNLAKGEAKSKVELAKAEAFRVKTVSVETAAAIQREGEAKAAALKAQANALRSSPELVALTRAEAAKNWDGKSMPQIIMGGAGNSGKGLFPFLDVAKILKDK
jgi:regulator of protease activity HflC (stomatin/prohibitin superfamily)